MENRIIVIALAFCLLVAGCGVQHDDKTVQNASVSGLANPASTHCVDKGGSLEIRTGPDGGQAGYCTLPNGTVCEEWAYFRGECP